MRKLKCIVVLIIITLFAVRNIAQCQYSPKRILLSSALNLQSGFFYGVGETLISHHSVSIFKNFPPTHFFGANSWERKYRDFPSDTRQRFLGSKTIFVGATDGYHLSRTLQRLTMNIATVVYEQPTKKWHKILDFCILQVMFQVGFYIEKWLLE